MAAQSRDSSALCPYCSCFSPVDVTRYDVESESTLPGPRNAGCRLCRVQRLSQSTLQTAKKRQIESTFHHSSVPLVGLENPLPEPVIATEFEAAFDSFRQFMSFASKQCGRYHGHFVSQHPHRYDNGGQQVAKEDALLRTSLAENAVKCPLAKQGAPAVAAQAKPRTSSQRPSACQSSTSAAAAASGRAQHASHCRPAAQVSSCAKRSPITDACHHYDQYHSQRQATTRHHGNPLQAGAGHMEGGGGVHVQVEPGTYVVTAARWGQQGRRHDTHIVNLEKEQCVQLTFAL